MYPINQFQTKPKQKPKRKRSSEREKTIVGEKKSCDFVPEIRFCALFCCFEGRKVLVLCVKASEIADICTIHHNYNHICMVELVAVVDAEMGSDKRRAIAGGCCRCCWCDGASV